MVELYLSISFMTTKLFFLVCEFAFMHVKLGKKQDLISKEVCTIVLDTVVVTTKYNAFMIKIRENVNYKRVRILPRVTQKKNH